MLQKNKLRNPLTFRENAAPGAKCKKNDVKCPAIHFVTISCYFAISV